MTDKDQIFNGMKGEFSSHRSEERAEYILEKVAELYATIKSQQAHIKKLEKAVDESQTDTIDVIKTIKSSALSLFVRNKTKKLSYKRCTRRSWMARFDW